MQRYSAVICNLERRRIIDLLPDRATSTVEAWPLARPGISHQARSVQQRHARSRFTTLSQVIPMAA